MIAPVILLTGLADANSASTIMRDYIAPIIRTLSVVGSLVSIFFLINGGFHYMTSSGKPERLEHAKQIIRNALLGLIIVLAAGVLTAILSHAYSSGAVHSTQQLPSLTTIQPVPVSNGLVDILIKAITGLLNNIVQSIAAPFLHALTFFTSSTPLLADNSSVFNLWLVVVGITDSLFVLVVALLGFHVMSASSFGFDEIEFKHLLPRLALVFLLVNISIFALDGLIELSNVMIRAINAGGSGASVWDVLTAITKQAGGLGVAALLIMIAFVIFAFILLVYYVGRLVTLYIGAVLSPIVLVLWLVPGFRDFAESAAKTYLTTIFVLFVHVIILTLAASLFAGLIAGSPTRTPDSLMAMVVGVATIIALLKTQGVMMQFSYASIGPRTARKLGGQFMNGITYTSGKSRTVAGALASRKSPKNENETDTSRKRSTPNADTRYKSPKNTTQYQTTKPRARAKTGETTVAPKATEPKEMEKP